MNLPAWRQKRSFFFSISFNNEFPFIVSECIYLHTKQRCALKVFFNFLFAILRWKFSFFFHCRLWSIIKWQKAGNILYRHIRLKTVKIIPLKCKDWMLFIHNFLFRLVLIWNFTEANKVIHWKEINNRNIWKQTIKKPKLKQQRDKK